MSYLWSEKAGLHLRIICSTCLSANGGRCDNSKSWRRSKSDIWVEGNDSSSNSVTAERDSIYDVKEGWF